MNFDSQQLSPSISGFLGTNSVEYVLPLTPFWNSPGTVANIKARGFHGSDFFFQNKSTLEFEEDLPENPGETRFVSNKPICGFAAYSVSTSVDNNDSSPTPSNGTLERAYVFDEMLNAVRLETNETGKHTIGGGRNTQTATTSIQGNQYEEPPTHVVISLSSTVNKSTLEAFLAQWRAKPEAFRIATNSGLGTYAYNGYAATKSEGDGALAEVGGGDITALPYVFGDFSVNGMTGSPAALWNGNFSADVSLVTRKNAPILHLEAYEDGENVVSGGQKNSSFVRTSIYRDGYSETELSEELTSWRDEYGVFETGEGLGAAPMFSRIYYDNFGFDNEGKEFELTLISKDGNQYRVTLERGDYSPGWTTVATHVLTTDAATLKTPATLLTHPNPGNRAMMRVAKIESFFDGEWITVSDIALGASPSDLITTHIRGAGLLLAVMKKRIGSRWGFQSLTGVGSQRYRVKSNKIHLTPGPITIEGGSCGGGVSGSYDAEWFSEYSASNGLLQPLMVTQWAATINGTDWTPETAPTTIGFTDSSLVTNTATKQRREGSGSIRGRFVVAFDVPDPNGRIISTSTVNSAVSFSGGINKTSEIALLPPDSGHSRFFGGYRLTY